MSITELLGMECEEDTKRKDEKERIEHCQKEIKRWKRYAIVLIAISAVLLAACIGGSIYVRYFIIEENQIIQKHRRHRSYSRKRMKTVNR